MYWPSEILYRCCLSKETQMSAVMDEKIKRWTARRESALVLEIIQGKTTLSEASCQFISSADKGTRNMARRPRRTHSVAPKLRWHYRHSRASDASCVGQKIRFKTVRVRGRTRDSFSSAPLMNDISVDGLATCWLKLLLRAKSALRLAWQPAEAR